ncbi:DUF4097 family beta strand repeat-containing protein [Paenibacillus sp. GCM10023252]|uniref:DUF4097 family beta strand repeat-containing protein n=1 Tax=Paenibacillus sp. GCM10023252 TaxID=3252649 RepID=UPI00360B08AA
MAGRKKRTVLIAAAALLFIMMIVDVSIRKEELLERFGEQFVHVSRTEAYEGALHGETAEVKQQLEVDRQGIEEVLLTGNGVNVSVQRAEGEEIRLEYVVKISASTKEKAAAKLKLIEVRPESTEGRLKFNAMLEGEPIHSDWVSVEYTLYLPDSLKLWVENEGGAVRIQGIQGDVEVLLARGMLEVLKVEGDVAVESSLGHVDVSGIAGDITLNNDNGQTNAEQIQGSVKLDTSYDHTQIRQVKGRVNGETQFGSIRVDDILGPVSLHGNETAIHASSIRGDLRVASNDGAVTLLVSDMTGYQLDAAATYGRILSHLPLAIVRDRAGDYTERMQGIVGEGTWKADVKAESADIIIQHR